MRFSLLPVLAPLAIGTGAITSRQAAPPPPVVVLVHGRGHLGDDSAALRRIWKRDLDSGLAAVGAKPIPEGDVRLAYYADVLDPALERGCDSLVDRLDGGAGPAWFARDFVASLASLLSDDEAAADVRAFLGDALYVMDESRRCAALRRVGDAIASAAKEHRPIIVVAYSLGALIAYDFLGSRMAKGLANVRLVTIGSPLGVPELRALLGHGSDSLRMPDAVTDWDNVYDPHDAFAASVSSRIAGRSARDRRTLAAPTGDLHHISRYLRDPATGAAIAAAR